MSSDVTASKINQYLRTLEEFAMNLNPPEKPLLADNPYYRSVKVHEDKLFHIYYAYYGYGKTYGVGLKFYHEARAGELKGIWDAILINLREMLSECYQFKTLVNKIPSSIPVALILATLQSALAIEKLIETPKCRHIFSTLTIPPYLNLKKTIENIALTKVMDDVDKVDYAISEIMAFTRKPITIIFDEFESTITLIAPQARLSDFLYELGNLMRKLYDRGKKKLRLVLLLQKALFTEDERKRFEEQIQHGYAGSPSAIAGILVKREIRTYEPEVYVKYIEEALHRLSSKFSEKILENTIDTMGLNRFRKALENNLIGLSNIPPRIAFPLVRNIVVEIATRALRNKIYSSRILNEIIHPIINEYVKVNEILRFYFRKDEISKIDYETLANASYELLRSISREIRDKELLKVSGKNITYPGSWMFRKHRVKGGSLDIVINAIIVRFKKIPAKSTISSLCNTLLKKHVSNINKYIEGITASIGKNINTINVKITVVILKIPEILLTPLQQATELALHKLQDELKKNKMLKRFSFNVNYRVLIHSLDEDVPITLYYIGSNAKPSDYSLDNYLAHRKEDLISELKNYFI